LTQTPFLPRTRARLSELGYPAPLAQALMGLACALDPNLNGPRIRRGGRRGGGFERAAKSGAALRRQRARL